MDISVVVPTYNRRQIVMESLQTLFAQDFPKARFEIIVVVDGSTDDTAAALRELQSDCTLRVIEQENRGLAGARNTGFRAAQSGLVLFLDDDMRCDRGLVSAHVKAHQRFGPGVIFGALFLTEDSKRNLAAECFKREIGAFYLEHQRDPSTKWDLRNCVFSNSSLPTGILAAANGFDERFRMREDLELGIRLQADRVPMNFAPEAIARQYYEKTPEDLLADAEQFAVADAELARKHPEQAIEGHLLWIEKQRGWKSSLRGLLVRFPLLEACLLAPLCAAGDSFFSIRFVRSAGLRALQMRRRIHWLRVVKRLPNS